MERSDSAVFSRAIRRMEEMGLLVRVNRWGRRRATRLGRTTHIRLTSAEEALARELAPQEAVEPDEAFDPDGMEIDPLYLPDERDPR